MISIRICIDQCFFYVYLYNKSCINETPLRVLYNILKIGWSFIQHFENWLGFCTTFYGTSCIGMTLSEQQNLKGNHIITLQIRKKSRCARLSASLLSELDAVTGILPAAGENFWGRFLPAAGGIFFSTKKVV